MVSNYHRGYHEWQQGMNALVQVLRESLPRLQLPPGAVIGPTLPGLGWSGSLALGQMNHKTMAPSALPSPGSASLLQRARRAQDSYFYWAHAALLWLLFHQAGPFSMCIWLEA